jgi:hypothetical protein
MACSGPTRIGTLARAPKPTEDTAMGWIDRSLNRHGAARIAATICLCWAAYCGPYDSNTWPLAFGMTPDEASSALGLPLTYFSGPPGSEVFLARGSAGVPGRFPVDAAIALQFRRGHLTGWKQKWSLPKPWIIY